MAGKKPGLSLDPLGALGNIAGKALGGALEGTGRAVAGIAEGTGTAIAGIAEGAGKALGGALQGLTTQPDTIINNVGMAGQIGKSKVVSSGSGSLPSVKNAPKPVITANMSSTKILSFAVTYLASIDNTLKNQLEYERSSFQQQKMAERESEIEQKSGGFFSNLMQNSDTQKKSKSNLSKGLLAGGAILGGLGLVGLANLDISPVDELGKNLKEFEKKYGWMLEVAGWAAAGSALGIQGAFAGAVVGVVKHFIFGDKPGSTRSAVQLTAGGFLGFALLKKPATRLAKKSWGKFLIWFAEKRGAAVAARLAQELVVAEVSAAAAVPTGGVSAIIGTLVTLGLSAWLLFDVATGLIEWLGVKEEETPQQVAGAGLAGTKDLIAGSYVNKVIASVINAGNGYTIVKYSDGTTETRTGTRASRNNNPGNIEYGDFAKSKGAIGSDGRFAVFPTVVAGFNAMDSLLKGGSYSGLSVSGAIRKYAPASENDTSAYIESLRKSGVDVSKKYSQLSTAQQTSTLRGMAKVEGFYAPGSGPDVGPTNIPSVDKVLDLAKNAAQVLGSFTSDIFNGPNAQFIPLEDMGQDKAKKIEEQEKAIQADQIMGLKRNTDKISTGASDASLKSIISTAAAINTPIDIINPNYNASKGSIINMYLSHYKLSI